MAAKKVSGIKEQKPVEPVDTEAVTVERRVVACNAQFITVDAGKLSKGLKTTFEGVAMVFDSIGLPVQLGLTMDFEDEDKGEGTTDAKPAASTVATEKVAVKKKAKAESKPEPTSEEETQGGEVLEEPAPIEETALAAEEPVAEPEPVVEPEAKEAPAEVTSSITIDDITKIIVQKIKQNRKNNEKIGAILKTYEVARVGDLHPSKYEAFLTDLSAI